MDNRAQGLCATLGSALTKYRDSLVLAKQWGAGVVLGYEQDLFYGSLHFCLSCCHLPALECSPHIYFYYSTTRALGMDMDPQTLEQDMKCICWHLDNFDLIFSML